MPENQHYDYFVKTASFELKLSEKVLHQLSIAPFFGPKVYSSLSVLLGLILFSLRPLLNDLVLSFFPTT